MRLLRTLIAAAALAMIAAPIATAPAFAQSSSPVLVVNLERVYAESLAGKDAQGKIKGIADAARQELEPEAKALESEAASLDARFKGKTYQQIAEEVQKDAALQTKYKSYQQRLSALSQKEDLRNAEIQATQRKAINDVLAAADPLVEELRVQRGAMVVLNANDVLKANPTVDVTPEVINRLNGKVTSIAVTKIDLSKQAQQQQ